MPPLVSVIIPTFNRALYIAEAIDSVLTQTYRPIELIVVDDGSTDETPEILARYQDRICVIRQENRGISRARNAGMSAATGQFIALLDSDDRWLPDKLQAQIPLFDEPNVGLVCGAFRCFRLQRQATLYTQEHFAGEKLDFHDLLKWIPLGTQTLVFPRHVVDALGMFDPDVDGCEDHEFCLRVALKYAIRGLPRLVAEVRHHDQQFSAARRTMYEAGIRVLSKYQSAHGDCAQCRQAAALARRNFRLTYYRDLNREARNAVSAGRLLKAVQLAARALWIHPGALARIPQKLLGIR